MSTTNATTTYDLGADDKAKLAKLAVDIATGFDGLKAALATGLKHARELSLALAEAKAICDKNGIKWAWWVRNHTTMTVQWADKLRKLADPLGWAKVEKAIASRHAGDRPMSVNEAIRIASGKDKRKHRSPITEGDLSNAISKAGVRLSVKKLVEILADLGVKIEKPKPAKTTTG